MTNNAPLHRNNNKFDRYAGESLAMITCNSYYRECLLVPTEDNFN